MTPRSIFAALAVAALCLQACTSSPDRHPPAPGENGATPGSVLGPAGNGTRDRIKGAVGGTIIGAFIVDPIGNSLTTEDVAQADAAQRRAYAAPVGHPVAWTNPVTGHAGTITVLRDAHDVSGDVCRDYEATVRVDGQTQRAYGTVCRRSDGDWAVIDN